jgi:hypothetical protein
MPDRVRTISRYHAGWFFMLSFGQSQKYSDIQGQWGLTEAEPTISLYWKYCHILDSSGLSDAWDISQDFTHAWLSILCIVSWRKMKIFRRRLIMAVSGAAWIDRLIGSSEILTQPRAKPLHDGEQAVCSMFYKPINRFCQSKYSVWRAHWELVVWQDLCDDPSIWWLMMLLLRHTAFATFSLGRSNSEMNVLIPGQLEWRWIYWVIYSKTLALGRLGGLGPEVTTRKLCQHRTR